MATRHWCFTLNNWTSDEDDALRQLGEDSITYLVYGYEVGDNGTKHLQGYVVFAERCRLQTAKQRVSPRAHLEAKRGTPLQAADYCKKDGVYVEFGRLPPGSKGVGRFDSFIDWVQQRKDSGVPPPSEREIANQFPSLWIVHDKKLGSLATHLYPAPQLVSSEVTLRDWQESLRAQLVTKSPCDRKIIFVVDPDGGQGKTFFQRYMVSSYSTDVQILSVGKRDDLAYALDTSKYIFLFNIPRGGMEFLNYTTMEQLKDRMVFSPKYDSRTKIWNVNVHVVVFCNEHPDETKMTHDRFEIVELS